VNSCKIRAASGAEIDDGNDRADALRTLMHGVDRDKSRRIANRHGRNAADIKTILVDRSTASAIAWLTNATICAQARGSEN
jgi:hypothetical protein